MFSASYKNSAAVLKDSVANIIQTGEFVCNMATYELRDAVALVRDYGCQCGRVGGGGIDGGAVGNGEGAAGRWIARPSRV